jgi:hypothetical protein
MQNIRMKITQAAEMHGNEPTTRRWICSILESRNIIIIGRKLEGVHDYGMSSRGRAFASAVQPGFG